MVSLCLCSHSRYYWAVIPGVIPAGQPNRMCVIVIKPNETLSVEANLISPDQNITIYHNTAINVDIHACAEIPVNHPKEKNMCM